MKKFKSLLHLYNKIYFTQFVAQSSMYSCLSVGFFTKCNIYVSIQNQSLYQNDENCKHENYYYKGKHKTLQFFFSFRFLLLPNKFVMHRMLKEFNIILRCYGKFLGKNETVLFYQTECCWSVLACRKCCICYILNIFLAFGTFQVLLQYL